MARKRYKEDDVGGIFGFAIDTIKVIFKPLPDKDQSFSEFIMEKLGAIAFLLFIIAFVALFILGVLMR